MGGQHPRFIPEPTGALVPAGPRAQSAGSSARLPSASSVGALQVNTASSPMIKATSAFKNHGKKLQIGCSRSGASDLPQPYLLFVTPPPSPQPQACPGPGGRLPPFPGTAAAALQRERWWARPRAGALAGGAGTGAGRAVLGRGGQPGSHAPPPLSGDAAS